MLILILFLIVGSILAYVSQYNFEPVSVNLGWYVFSQVPLFYVMVASLVTGLVLAYAMHLVHAFSNSMMLRAKENELKKNKGEIAELTKRVHQLEIQNDKLKAKTEAEPKDHLAL